MLLGGEVEFLCCAVVDGLLLEAVLLEEPGDAGLLFGCDGESSVAIAVVLWCAAEDFVELVAQGGGESCRESFEQVAHAVGHLDGFLWGEEAALVVLACGWQHDGVL